jgi:hypothetical protein
LIQKGLKKPGVQVFHPNGDIGDGTRSLELCTAYFGANKARDRLGSIRVVVRSVRGIGIRNVGGMPWRGRRAKSWQLWQLDSERELRNRKGNTVSIVKSFVLSLPGERIGTLLRLCSEEIRDRERQMDVGVCLAATVFIIRWRVRMW